MAQFLCCTLQSNKEGGGEPVWINVDLVTAIQVDQFGLGSKISFAGDSSPQLYIQEKPHQIFERPKLTANTSPSP